MSSAAKEKLVDSETIKKKKEEGKEQHRGLYSGCAGQLAVGGEWWCVEEGGITHLYDILLDLIGKNWSVRVRVSN